MADQRCGQVEKEEWILLGLEKWIPLGWEEETEVQVCFHIVTSLEYYP